MLCLYLCWSLPPRTEGQEEDSTQGDDRGMTGKPKVHIGAPTRAMPSKASVTRSIYDLEEGSTWLFAQLLLSLLPELLSFTESSWANTDPYRFWHVVK